MSSRVYPGAAPTILFNWEGHESMPSLRILNASGDTCISWDTEAYAAGDPEAVAAVEEAERLFAAARAAGGEAFQVEAGAPARRLTRLTPTMTEDVLVIPPMVGG